jgi:hypothetical protein
MPKGKKGFQKGHKGFRKNYLPLTKKVRNKISQSLKGRTAWNKGKHTGFKPWLGKKRSIETIKKMSKAMKGKFSGSKHWHWNGGMIKNGSGYILILKPKHPFANNLGYVRRSHLVMEKIIRRHIKPQEVVHHINGNKIDDRPENLKLFVNHSIHMKSSH